MISVVDLPKPDPDSLTEEERMICKLIVNTWNKYYRDATAVNETPQSASESKEAKSEILRNLNFLRKCLKYPY